MGLVVTQITGLVVTTGLAKSSITQHPRKSKSQTNSKMLKLNEVMDITTNICVICGDTYENSASGEEWIKCNSCTKWAHDMCTEGNDIFQCPACE